MVDERFPELGQLKDELAQIRLAMKQAEKRERDEALRDLRRNMRKEMAEWREQCRREEARYQVLLALEESRRNGTLKTGRTIAHT